ncbi:MAG: DNA mismatch repair endonuclease MutL [Saccharofermentans sp.]|nr:DNA mismatch repair endonuclease MutL [Saccharofermentans sp.]
MSRINVLDTVTANAIKAGEVIERPVSVVKELVDNSVDAGATSIKIEFDNGGISLIRVSDNGCGMDDEDAHKCFLIHATSKIKTASDIYDLSTMGFRGEALASIAACADVTLVTKQADMDAGVIIEYRNGLLSRDGQTSADNGTVVTVEKLFANMPARYKFLKRDATESMYICSLVEKLAIINPHISFRLIKDGKQILSTPGNGNMRDIIYSIYGKETANALVEIKYELNGLKIRGFAGKPSFVRGNRGLQYVYANERTIKSAVISSAIDEAYKTSVMKHKHPICVLCIYIPAGEVDVNVHPQKAEVKFSDDSAIFRLVYHGIKNALFGENSTIVEDTNVLPVIDSPVKQSESHSISPTRVEMPVTRASSEATDNLLKILAGFKPDIEEIENDTNNKLPELIEENKSVEADDFIEDAFDRKEIIELVSSEFVGFLFSTYVIFQNEVATYLVDQHAAHERVLLERFSANRNEIKEGSRNVESLLIPQVIDLSSADLSYVSDNLERFKEFGFDIDIVGERQIALRTVPVATKSEDRLKSLSKPSVMFTQILNDLKRETPEKSNVWTSLIQTTACKAAIKAGDVITKEEAMSLIEQLKECRDPYHCAHGRPTFIKTHITDIEKMFKRIV